MNEVNFDPCEMYPINTLRPRQYVRHFADDIFKCIFFNENVWISLKFSLKFVPKVPIDNITALVQTMVPIDNITALVQTMTWHHSGDKPLSEPMMVNFLMHIRVTRPQWVYSSVRNVGFDIFVAETSLYKRININNFAPLIYMSMLCIKS